MIVWPFPSTAEMIERLEWRTDVIRSRASEQRIAMRSVPRRIFSLTHVANDALYSRARAITAYGQAVEFFGLPDWAQSRLLGALPAAASHAITDDGYTDIAETGIVWESPDKYEVVSVERVAGNLVLSETLNDYSKALFMPLLLVQCQDGLSADRGPGGLKLKTTRLSVELTAFDNTDIAAIEGAEYQGLSVLDSCPIVGDGSIEESLAWPLATFDNGQNTPHYLRERRLINSRYGMRWHLFDRESVYKLRQWLYAHRGRQRAFWLSSRRNDFRLALPSLSTATTIRIYSTPELTEIWPTPYFDIDITLNDGSSIYRRVTNAAFTASIDGNPTAVLTIDSQLGVDIAPGSVKRISFMQCSRLDSDTVELTHRAGAGVMVSAVCTEVPVP